MNQNERSWRDHRDELFDRVVKQGRARKRRRAVGTGATVITLLLAIAGGLYLPDRDHHSLRVAGNDHGTTTTVPPAKDQRVLLIGDSVMRLAQPEIEHAIPSPQVETNSAWQLGDAVAALKTVKEHGGLPPTIVIHLGDNGPGIGDVFDQWGSVVQVIMDTVGSESQVYFVTLKLPRTWESQANSALYQVGSYPNAHVLAWHDFAIGHDNWFLADGFHLSAIGRTAYAGFILNGIRPPVSSYRR